MIVISDIDENGINTNLHVRYKQDIIYVSFCIWKKMLIGTVNCVSATRDGRLIMYYLWHNCVCVCVWGGGGGYDWVDFKREGAVELCFFWGVGGGIQKTSS